MKGCRSIAFLLDRQEPILMNPTLAAAKVGLTLDAFRKIPKLSALILPDAFGREAVQMDDLKRAVNEEVYNKKNKKEVLDG